MKHSHFPVLPGLLWGKGEQNIPEVSPDSWIRQLFNTNGWAEVPHATCRCPSPGRTTFIHQKHMFPVKDSVRYEKNDAGFLEKRHY